MSDRPKYPDTWNSRTNQRECSTASPCDACHGAKPVTIQRSLLYGWPTTPPLSGAAWRAFAESLPAGEYATTLLFVADAIDQTDGTGRYAPKEESK